MGKGSVHASENVCVNILTGEPASEQNSVDICMDIMYKVEQARPSL
jgi:hypothetical protein